MENNTPLKGLPRSVEITLALSGLVVLLPLFVLVALAIKISSSGPALFSQRRMGFGGKEFTMYKFRTMCVVQSGPLITASNDRRITRLGKALRKTKIDEMPGLWNVLKG